MSEMPLLSEGHPTLPQSPRAIHRCRNVAVSTICWWDALALLALLLREESEWRRPEDYRQIGNTG